MEGDPALIMPDCDKLIAIHFNSCGRCSSSDGGIGQISWNEINSYMQSNRVYLSRFELDVIRGMSVNYVANRMDDNPNKSPPYLRELTHEEAIQREKVLERMIEQDERKIKSPT